MARDRSLAVTRSKFKPDQPEMTDRWFIRLSPHGGLGKDGIRLRSSTETVQVPSHPIPCCGPFPSIVCIIPPIPSLVRQSVPIGWHYLVAFALLQAEQTFLVDGPINGFSTGGIVCGKQHKLRSRNAVIGGII